MTPALPPAASAAPAGSVQDHQPQPPPPIEPGSDATHQASAATPLLRTIHNWINRGALAAKLFAGGR
jgi:hypothetical protein